MPACPKSSTNFLLNGDIGEMTLQAAGTEDHGIKGKGPETVRGQ